MRIHLSTPLVHRAVGAPAVLALALSTLLSSLPLLQLSRPERVAIAVECTYQNTGIATSLALSMFDKDEASRWLRPASNPRWAGSFRLERGALLTRLGSGGVCTFQ